MFVADISIGDPPYCIAEIRDVNTPIWSLAVDRGDACVRCLWCDPSDSPPRSGIVCKLSMSRDMSVTEMTEARVDMQPLLTGYGKALVYADGKDKLTNLSPIESSHVRDGDESHSHEIDCAIAADDSDEVDAASICHVAQNQPAHASLARHTSPLPDS